MNRARKTQASICVSNDDFNPVLSLPGSDNDIRIAFPFINPHDIYFTVEHAFVFRVNIYGILGARILPISQYKVEYLK